MATSASGILCQLTQAVIARKMLSETSSRKEEVVNQLFYEKSCLSQNSSGIEERQNICLDNSGNFSQKQSRTRPLLQSEALWIKGDISSRNWISPVA